MQVKCYDLNTIEEGQLQYAVIVARYREAFIFVRHKNRETWEVPGGKRENGESIDNTAQRELFEETGAQSFEISPIFDYSVTRDEAEESFGRVYYAEVKELQVIPIGSEIREVGFMNDLPYSLTYPAIQPILYRQALRGIS